MNPFLQLFLMLALVTGGIATYHVLVDDGSRAATDEVAPVGDRDLAALEARVLALENRAPLLRGSTDGGELLLDLQGRVQALEVQPARRTTEGTEGIADSAIQAPPPGGAVAAAGESVLSDEQEQAVRRLVDGAVRERIGGRGADRIDRALERLGFELTIEQREKLDAAWSAHRESMGEVMRAGREAGLDREEIRPQMTALTQKFTRDVAEFLPAGDAEAISGALTARGRGPDGGRGRGGGR